MPIAELVPEDVPDDAVRALLDRFADARLLTLGDGTAEVAHEVLIREWPTLRGWLEEDREGLRAAPAARRRRAHLGRRGARCHATSTAAPGSAPRSSGRRRTPTR